MDTIFAFLIAAVVTGLFVFRHLKSLKKRDARAREAAEKGKLYSEGPKAQHPHIDTTYCIGCATCTTVCPEGDVLAMLGGKAVIVNGHKCIGHSLCAEACPVGAITMVMASPSMGADMPYLTPEYETSVENLFIVGELGGLALIKNAVNQGRDCIDTIASRIADNGSGQRRSPGGLRRPDRRRWSRRESAPRCAPSRTSSTTSPWSGMKSAARSPSIRARSWS